MAFFIDLRVIHLPCYGQVFSIVAMTLQCYGVEPLTWTITLSEERANGCFRGIALLEGKGRSLSG